MLLDSSSYGVGQLSVYILVLLETSKCSIMFPPWMIEISLTECYNCLMIRCKGLFFPHHEWRRIMVVTWHSELVRKMLPNISIGLCNLHSTFTYVASCSSYNQLIVGITHISFCKSGGRGSQSMHTLSPQSGKSQTCQRRLQSMAMNQHLVTVV